MSMPTPSLQDNKEVFMQNCITDATMIDAYPLEQQRQSVCEQQWLNRKKTMTYNDYPESASNNAKKALKFRDENNNPNNCGTRVGWQRANQLASKQAISRDTIARMASFKRHQQHSDVPYSEGCGGLMWDAWGGTSGINWAERKLEQIDKKAYNAIVINKISYKTYMEKEQKNKGGDNFIQKYKAFKNGESTQAPRLEIKGAIKRLGETYKVVMSKEIRDRDGEVVKLSGCRNLGESVVFIDAHMQNGSVITTRLGTAINSRIDGDEMVADIKFVNTEAGKQAEMIAADKDHVFPVSIGFGVYEFDEVTKEVLDWEQYEVSAVNVPANKGAMIKNKSLEEGVQRLEKAERDARVLKEYRRVLMSNKLWSTLGLTKGENELANVVVLCDILKGKLNTEETPRAIESKATSNTEETPRVVSLNELKSFVR